MSFKDKFGNVMKQAVNVNTMKEKVIDLKDRTFEKVKGIDNPEHYSAPIGFECFKVPVAMSVPELPKTLDKLESFQLSSQDKIVDAYVRMLTLLKENETIIEAIVATMKNFYLIIWTNHDRLFIIHKEHYKVYEREKMETLKMTGTTTNGLAFQLNEYTFVGIEKAKTYQFIRKYCHEQTPDLSFSSYLPISHNLNYYERFKYGKLTKENNAIEENRKLSTLFSIKEYPLVSIYATYSNTPYILTLTTTGMVYMIDTTKYAKISRLDIEKIALMNKGTFACEFYMDNYYFTNCGVEASVLKLIQYLTDPVSFEEAKEKFFKEHMILTTFPFQGATSYQTPGGEAIVIDASKQTFLIHHSFKREQMYQCTDFLRYEFIEDYSVSKDEMWSRFTNDNKPISKEEAIQKFDDIIVRLYVKEKDEAVLELPFLLLKKTRYQETDEVVKPCREVAKELLDTLDGMMK